MHAETAGSLRYLNREQEYSQKARREQDRSLRQPHMRALPIPECFHD